jgi:hypothetical protein
MEDDRQRVPREVLRAYADKRASIDEVMRALVEYDGWLVPQHLLGRNVVERLVVFAEEFSVPAESALVFTDREGADAFAAKHGGRALGVYVSPITGVELFQLLASDRPECTRLRELRVNEGAPRSELWYMEASTFELAAQLARAVALERSIAAARATGKVGDLVDHLLAFSTWVLPVGKADRSFVRVTISDDGEHVVVFTAHDRAKALTDEVPPEDAEKLGYATITGRDLFPLLARSPFAGAIVNPNSEPQLVLSAEMLKLLV